MQRLLFLAPPLRTVPTFEISTMKIDLGGCGIPCPTLVYGNTVAAVATERPRRDSSGSGLETRQCSCYCCCVPLIADDADAASGEGGKTYQVRTRYVLLLCFCSYLWYSTYAARIHHTRYWCNAGTIRDTVRMDPKLEQQQRQPSPSACTASTVADVSRLVPQIHYKQQQTLF